MRMAVLEAGVMLTEVPVPVSTPDALSVVNAPVPGVPLPMAVAVSDTIVPSEVREDAVTPAAKVAPVNPLAGTAAAVMDVLQPKPVFVVHDSALAAVLHDPTESAVGTAVPEVAFPSTVLVACAATFVAVVAVVAFPTSAPVNVVAATCPAPSRSMIVDAVFAAVASDVIVIGADPL